MSRAIRRHHEERLKRKWRGILLTQWGADCYYRWGEQELQRQTGSRAHHPRHYCQVCKIGAKYERHIQSRKDREEMDMTRTL
jgi:hypothetical protein